MDDVTIASVEGTIRRTLRRLRGVRGDVRDLEQATWVRLLERLAAAEPIVDVSAYATGIARNVFREELQTLRRREHLARQFAVDLEDLGQAGAPASAERTLERRELAARFERAYGCLASHEAWLVDARYFEDVSYAELLPRFRRRFGSHIHTEEGLRSALYQARQSMLAALLADDHG